jgi:hypothetical protein
MHVKLFYLPSLLVMILFFQACVVSGAETKSSQAAQNQTVSKHKPKVRKEAYKTSPYKPSELQLELDFEDEEIRPLEGREKTYDKLVLQTPNGTTTSVGIMYEGGDDKDRKARIVADPEDPANRVMHFWLKNARVPDQKKGKFKGRIQVNFPNVNKTSLFMRYRLYLHPDVAFYTELPKQSTRFIVGSMWMGQVWKGHKHPFKLSLRIAKPKGVGTKLYFVAAGGTYVGGDVRRGKWKDVWAEAGYNFEVPIGEWIDIEVGYKAGDKKTGRYYLGAKRARDSSFTTVFDVTNWTYNPQSPEPVPITNIQPIKLYSSGSVIDFIRKKGGVAQVYWDDFEAYDNW